MIKRTLAAVAMTVVAGSSGAATISNGSFEDIGGGTLNSSGWNLFTSIPDWTADHRVEVQSNPTIGAVDAQHGFHYVELVTNRNDSLLQDVFLEIGMYKLSFFYSPRVSTTGTTSNDMAYSVGTPQDTLTSGVVEGGPGPDTPWGSWTEITSVFSVTEAGNYTLSFTATGSANARGCGNCGALIDNVTLATMPLPASSLLLLAGVVGLGAVGVRNQRRRG
ncbi:MAG: hypothetical protein AAGA38_16945 [Pseudomonadota bacterium]